MKTNRKKTVLAANEQDEDLVSRLDLEHSRSVWWKSVQEIKLQDWVLFISLRWTPSARQSTRARVSRARVVVDSEQVGMGNLLRAI